MTEGIVLAACAALLSLLLAGTRSAAYVLLYFAFLPFLTLDPSQGGLVAVDGLQGGNVAWKLGVRALATTGIFAIALRRRGEVFALLARPASLPIFALFAWALIGLPRAQDPWVSFFRLGELLAFFVTGVVLAVEAEKWRPSRVTRLHSLALLPVLACAIAFTFLHPEIAFHESSSGVKRMGHKLMNSNVLGFAGTVVLLWSVSTLRCRLLYGPDSHAARSSSFARNWVPVLTLAVSAYVLYHARSRTASIAALGGCALLFLPWPSPGPESGPGRSAILQRRRLAMIAAASVGVLVLALSIGAIETWFLRGGTASDVATGTGRTGLWQDLLLLQVPKAPLLGAGYLNLSSAGGFEHAGHAWNNAHNTYLFALVSTGIPGLLCVIAIIGWPLWTSFRRAVTRPLGTQPDALIASAYDQEAWTLVFAFQAIIAVASITGFGVAGYPNVAMLFHYGLYAWTTSPVHASRPSALTEPPPLSTSAAPSEDGFVESARLFARQHANVPQSVR